MGRTLRYVLGSKREVAHWAAFDVGHELTHETRTFGRLHGDDRILAEAAEGAAGLRGEERLRNGQLVAQGGDGAEQRGIAAESAKRGSIAREERSHGVG